MPSGNFTPYPYPLDLINKVGVAKNYVPRTMPMWPAFMSADLRFFDVQLKHLHPDLRHELAEGDSADTQAIIEMYGLQRLYKFLSDVFGHSPYFGCFFKEG